MLLNYMNETQSGWNRSSIRLSKMEYEVLLYLSKRMNISPTTYVEKQRILYNLNKGESNNFTAFFRDSMFKFLIGDKK